MILAPDRRIIAPARRPIVAPSPWRHPFARRPLRRRRHRPYCPLFNMADGDLQLVGTADGILLDAAGNRVLTCCCGDALYVQARRCVDDTYADLWFLLSDHTDDGTDAGTVVPFYFTIAGVVYLVDDTSTTSATPGTLAGGYTSATGCPLFWQARLCTTAELVDLWVPDSALTPGQILYFKLGTTRYFIRTSPDGVSSRSPGTIATGYTVIPNCSEFSCCPDKTEEPRTPRTFVATIGLTVCRATFVDSFGKTWTVSDLSGTYELNQVATPAPPLVCNSGCCSWLVIIPNAYVVVGTTTKTFKARLVFTTNDSVGVNDSLTLWTAAQADEDGGGTPGGTWNGSPGVEWTNNSFAVKSCSGHALTGDPNDCAAEGDPLWIASSAFVAPGTA